MYILICMEYMYGVYREITQCYAYSLSVCPKPNNSRSDWHLGKAITATDTEYSYSIVCSYTLPLTRSQLAKAIHGWSSCADGPLLLAAIVIYAKTWSVFHLTQWRNSLLTVAWLKLSHTFNITFGCDN